jgi:glycosyltransferase involved in cell wall biosynthesis
MDANNDPRIVLVHDWLTGMRGGEKCLEILCRHWPDAPLFTLLHKRGSVSPIIENRPLSTSFLHYLPAVDRYYRYLLPLMPTAVQRWHLPPCDLVISLSHCVAKAVQPPAGVPHVCYCFTPMRYAWHQRDAYFGARLGRLKTSMLERVLEVIRDWDRRTATRVTHFVAISRTVQQRLEECYGRSSTVIYPPVDTDFYCPAPVQRQEYYLVVSAFAPYKRLDLAIAACNRLRKPLVIIGTGQDAGRLRALAGPTISFLGWQPDAVIRDHLRRCRALLFPGEEDFGIVPVEAQACGTPVIGFGRGGASETVLPMNPQTPSQHTQGSEPTGLWFHEQNADCLGAAIRAFEACMHDFHPAAARRQALLFNPRRFQDELFGYLDHILQPTTAPLRKAA